MKKILILLLTSLLLSACSSQTELHPPKTTVIEEDLIEGDLEGPETIKATGDYNIDKSAFAVTDFKDSEAPLMVGIFPVGFSTSVVHNPLPYVKGAIVRPHESTDYTASVHLMYRTVEKETAVNAVNNAPKFLELNSKTYHFIKKQNGVDKKGNPTALFQGTWNAQTQAGKTITVTGGLFAVAKEVKGKTYLGALLVARDEEDNYEYWNEQISYLINSVYLRERD